MQVPGTLGQYLTVELSQLAPRILKLRYLFTLQVQKGANLVGCQQQPCQVLYLL